MSQRASRSILPALLAAAVLAAASVLQAQTPTLVLPGAPTTPVVSAAPGGVAGPPIQLVPGSVPITMPTPPATMPTTMPSTMPAMPMMPGTSPAAEVAPVTQPFLAAVTGDKVYVRSGPDQKYYEIGQLTKGDLVYVTGLNKGFYQILPPNGSFCLIDKQYIAPDATGKVGALTGDYVNVHAGSATLRGDPYAILPPSLRKGASVKILGTEGDYYQIAPPEKACFFISAQFVKAVPANTQYKVAQLKLPAGAAGPTGITVEAPVSLPTVAITGPEVPTPTPVAPTPVTPAPVVADGATPAAPAAVTPLPPIVPAVVFSETASARFRDANGRYQEESKKPLAQQNLDGLDKEFKDILALDNLSPSVKAGSQADITAIERTLTVQKLLLEQQAANADVRQQSDALHDQLAAADRAIAAAREAGPYSAQGLLQSSTVVTGKYALVNPQTGRVVAYVDPATAQVDIGSLMGKYIGVRGMSHRMENSDVVVIQVNNATLMPEPK